MAAHTPAPPCVFDQKCRARATTRLTGMQLSPSLEPCICGLEADGELHETAGYSISYDSLVAQHT
eukprot:3416490-Prymnesium_polylepis.1